MAVASKGGDVMNVANFKESVRAAAGYRCQDCGMTQANHVKRYGVRLHVHRLKAEADGGRYEDGNCVACCCPCHGKRHRADASPRGRTRPNVSTKPRRSKFRVSRETHDRFHAFLADYNRGRIIKIGPLDAVELAVMQYLDREEVALTEPRP